MRRRGFTWIEATVVLVTLGILAAILYPAIRPRPLMFTKVLIPPLQYQQADLHTVMARMDSEMQKKKRYELSKIKWEDKDLKRRKVSLMTDTELKLREVLQIVESGADVHVDFGGTCGTCGGPIGVPMVRDKRRQS